MNILITADSTCDLGEELCARYQIGIMPLDVILGEQTYKDGVDIVPQDIFDYVERTNVLPKTAAPSIEEFKEFFAEQIKKADHVIHFSISQKASSSHSNACLAAETFNGKVSVVDSMALSTGQGLLVLKARDLANQGMTPEQIVTTVEGLRDKLNTSFVPDRLDYLHKGGRCSLAAMIGATVLKLHPMIAMKDGQMYAAKKYKGSMDRAVKTYIDDLVAEYPTYDRTRCFITHSNADEELVQKVKEWVAEKFHFEEVLETKAGCVITSHCGRNTLGVLFITE